MENAIARTLDEIEQLFVDMAIGTTPYFREKVDAIGSLRLALRAYAAFAKGGQLTNKWKPSGEGSSS
jgi:hypothetical protein